MASFADICKVRLEIGDPAGIINITQVATPADLPTDPYQQVAYFVLSTGRFMATDKESGAAPADYHTLELFISNTQISQLITAYDVEGAPCQAYGIIASRIGSKLRVKSMSSGAESTEYVALMDAYRYYKSLAADCTEKKNGDDLNTTGRYGKTSQPEIGGGNL
jgi:hypothetical protein